MAVVTSVHRRQNLVDGARSRQERRAASMVKLHLWHLAQTHKMLSLPMMFVVVMNYKMVRLSIMYWMGFFYREHANKACFIALSTRQKGEVLIWSYGPGYNHNPFLTLIGIGFIIQHCTPLKKVKVHGFHLNPP